MNEEYGISEQICGHNVLLEIKNNRRSVAIEKLKWRKVLAADGTPPATRRKTLNRMLPSPEKPLDWVLEKTGLELLESSHRPCPPLPCGADDAWIERAEENRLRGFAYLDAAAILRTQWERRNAPNLHAFDEAYYSS